MALVYSEYQSVKDCLPKNDGKFYDVICIVVKDNIEHSYSYKMGQYTKNCFLCESGLYFKKKDFRCAWKQEKIIAWKALDKATPDKIHEFYAKAGC